MKNLIIYITLIFLISPLIGTQTVNAQTEDAILTLPNDFPNIFFNMHISNGYINDDNPSKICFNFVLESLNLYSGHVITIMDELGRQEGCNEEPCSLQWTWCYEIDGQYDMLIQCFLHNHKGGLFFKEGCIITIDPSGTVQNP